MATVRPNTARVKRPKIVGLPPGIIRGAIVRKTTSDSILRQMKRTAIILVLALGVITANAVQVTLQYFQAKSNGNSIVLEWKSNAESDVAVYEVERAGSDNVFRYVGSVSAKGSNQSYSFTDDEAFGKRDGNNETITRNYFTYRLKVVAVDKNVSYSNSVGVVHNVSGIKRTWGMIKEMFR